jgi:hypothetical protein
VRIRCETGVFGVDPNSLEMAEDEENGMHMFLIVFDGFSISK